MEELNMEVNMGKTVTKIDANPLLMKSNKQAAKLRVAAYCRVSTDEDEQINSYEAQIAYYTEAIAKNPSWSFAGVYADEGITGTLTSKRKDFLRLMNDCEKGKIDMILTKSISRFARNTVDSLSWVRKLRAMNVGVYFEEQAIDSLKAENEMLIGLFSVIAQAESENISANVRWGIQQSMKSGKFCSNFSCFGYKRGADGVPEIIPEEAEVVCMIYDRYLDGYSIDQIRTELFNRGVKTPKGKEMWGKESIASILKNEKYEGDLLLQKTYRTDCISKKTRKNRGEMPKYLVTDNHPAIISRDKFRLVQMEIARRGSKHKKSSLAITEQGKHSGKYALSDLLICGQCGSHYRRRQKLKNGNKKYYWRCINRIENGETSCDADSIEEKKLHTAICKCLNKIYDDSEAILSMMESNLQAVLSGDDSTKDAFSIERQIKQLEKDAESYMDLMSSSGANIEKYMAEIEKNHQQIKILRKKLDIVKNTVSNNEPICNEVSRIMTLFKEENTSFEEYDDVLLRRLVECIRVMKGKKIVVVLKGGLSAEETIE